MPSLIAGSAVFVILCQNDRSLWCSSLVCCVHVRNLHPGAILYSGCKFAPGVKIFGRVNDVFRICTGVQSCSFSQGGANSFVPRCKLFT